MSTMPSLDVILAMSSPYWGLFGLRLCNLNAPSFAIPSKLAFIKNLTSVLCGARSICQQGVIACFRSLPS